MKLQLKAYQKLSEEEQEFIVDYEESINERKYNSSKKEENILIYITITIVIGFVLLIMYFWAGWDIK